MTDSLTLAQARASWWQKQALAGTSKRPLAALIGESGWLRTLGGADAYIAARARRPGMERAELDAAIAAGELRVHPAVRGCIYLVPAAAVPDLLATAGKLAPPAPDHMARVARVVDAFLGFAAPATLAQLSAWSGHPQRDLKTALARTDAVPVEVEGVGETYARAADLKARPPEPRGTALVALEDNYLNNHGVAAVTDPRHHAFEVDLWGGGKPAPIGKAQHVLSRSIVIDGLVAGFWEVDPRAAGAVWYTFDPAPRALARELDELTARTATFLLGELGHARVFTLDTMDDVQARADRIARLAGKKPAAVKATVARAPRSAVKRK